MPAQALQQALTHQLWLPTGLAANTLGVSGITLKRYADRDGFLIEDKHWRRGPHPNSPRVWEINACRAAITRRGRHGRGSIPQ